MEGITNMTQPEFETAIEQLYHALRKQFGDDACQTAMISVVEVGPANFNDVTSLRNYLWASARGDQRIEWKRGSRRQQIHREYRDIARAHNMAENTPDARIDLERAISHYAPEMQSALREHFIGGVTMTQAGECLSPTLTPMQRFRAVNREVKILLKGRLKSYAS
jgi:DNA-directed RNA polymerase specialized sigma24 family protein